MRKFIEFIDEHLPNEIYEKIHLGYDHKNNRYHVLHDGEKTKGFINKLFEKYDSIFHKKKVKRLLYEFKRETLSEMNKEFKAASSRGILNEDVFSDLVISNHPELEHDFEEFCTKKINSEKIKNKGKYNAIGSVIFILALVSFYLFISFTTQAWDITWLIIVDGILLWVAYILGFGVVEISKLKRIYFVLARICLAFATMVTSVAAFLFVNSYLNIKLGWLFVIAGVVLMFICDGIYIVAKKQRLAIINLMVYIPAVAAMIFVMLGGAGVVAWRKGWLLIIAGLALDVIIAISNIIKNKKFQREVYAQWKED